VFCARIPGYVKGYQYTCRNTNIALPMITSICLTSGGAVTDEEIGAVHDRIMDLKKRMKEIKQ